MTNWEHIKTLDPAEIASRLSISVIPADVDEPMFIAGVGTFKYADDFEDWLKAEYTPSKR